MIRRATFEPAPVAPTPRDWKVLTHTAAATVTVGALVGIFAIACNLMTQLGGA